MKTVKGKWSRWEPMSARMSASRWRWGAWQLHLQLRQRCITWCYIGDVIVHVFERHSIYLSMVLGKVLWIN